MAVESSALRDAILAFSSAHRANHADTESSRASLRWGAASLKACSIKSLRREISSIADTHPATVFAACLMLCVCALCHDNEDYNSWRMHLLGARAILPAIRAGPSDSKHLDPSNFFLQRRYSLLEAVASLTRDGFQAQDLTLNPYGASSQPSQIFFDHYCGCYTDVLEILSQIGAVAWERRQIEHTNCVLLSFSDADFELEALDLESRLVRMLERDLNTRPVFAAGFEDTLDEKQAMEFTYCNIICEYAALINFYTRIRKLSSPAEEVQQPIKRIIHLTQQLEPTSGLSPVLGLNTALFTAGCHAIGEDRAIITNLLSSFHQATRNHNMINTLDVLNMMWNQTDQGYDQTYGMYR